MAIIDKYGIPFGIDYEELYKRCDEKIDEILKKEGYTDNLTAEQIALVKAETDKIPDFMLKEVGETTQTLLKKMISEVTDTLIYKKTNPKKANPNIAIRNQEISDRCYAAGYHTQEKPRKGTWKQVFQEIAKDYPLISWHQVQKIAKNKTIIPTPLQTSK